jgi:poly(hydroxyalkanoate) depolymerase family esterase
MNPITTLRQWLARRRAPAQPGRFALRQKSSLHGFIGFAAAPPWREYLLYLPRGMERLKRPPLVVWIHGCRQDPEEFAAGTRIALFADERGFAVLLPRQNRLANSERCWNWFDRRTARGLGEAAIVAAQAADALARFTLDEKRVYVAGLSSGGALAAALALHVPGLARAVAIHSGLPCGVAQDSADAARLMADGPKADVLPATRGRVPALIIHGTEDKTVAPANATSLARQFLVFNGGAITPAATPDRDYYAGRRLAASVVLLAGLGHAWSGGDPAYPFFAAGGADATRLICDFFSDH